MDENDLQGKIHSFESFGTVDGPGIRNVVFLQGCNFRCQYCHNPDTWDVSGGTLKTAYELKNQILRFKPYFEASGGGVTISGGEPLLQAPFVAQLFKLLKQEGIHTCVDTNGSFPESLDKSILDELLSYTDLVLLDIKQMNEKEHFDLTCRSNTQTLEFASILSDKQIPVWLRYVVVPRLTDSDRAIASFKDFASKMHNVQNIEFLPFHKLGEFKWEALGLPYRLKDTLPPDTEFMKKLL